MSGINVKSGDNLNSEGKPYHEHGDKIEKKKHESGEHHKHPEHHEHQEPKEHISHGHDNQYHKDIKGSSGSGSSALGDRKADKEAS
ncbi:hypothetical protein I4U23_029453 [Adineta vaga]|nr:hypothetical protein I4U23_029453 [Adineta vaga]